MNLYDITVRGRNGDLISLSQYKEKTLLIVNTATGCGFTPQYEGLETLYRKYKNQGFEILDFPCNQFGHQAPGTEEEIHEFCTMNYEVSFPQFAKIEVNGSGESPLYSYLKSQKSGFFGSKIKWNFTKFLVDKEGTVVNRYAPTDKPEQLEKDILALLEGFTNLAAKRS
jgi:glutathione peroxidase